MRACKAAFLVESRATISPLPGHAGSPFRPTLRCVSGATHHTIQRGLQLYVTAHMWHRLPPQKVPQNYTKTRNYKTPVHHQHVARPYKQQNWAQTQEHATGKSPSVLQASLHPAAKATHLGCCMHAVCTAMLCTAVLMPLTKLLLPLPLLYSHSMVLGGLLVMSYTTRLTLRTCSHNIHSIRKSFKQQRCCSACD